MKPFEFKNSKTRPLERTYVNEGQPGSASALQTAAGGDKLKEKLAEKQRSVKTRSSAGKPPAKQPSSTRATALLQQRRREEFE